MRCDMGTTSGDGHERTRALSVRRATSPLVTRPIRHTHKGLIYDWKCVDLTLELPPSIGQIHAALASDRPLS